jgi:mycoredoxin-dependent peroxiredoxin
MANFQKSLETLEGTDTQVLGVSMDSPFANKAFADSLGAKFPLLSDRDGTVSKAYGVYDEKNNVSRRANILIDKEGKIIEMQLGNEAISPDKIVTACERTKGKG